MNKTKIILSAVGGVVGVLTLVMAYLVWTAYAAKQAAIEGDDEEGVEGLETVVEKAGTLSRKAVYPCKASVEALTSNKTAVAEWQAEAFKLAARGDRPVKAMTPAQFKTDIVADAKRLVALPGGVQGMVAKPDFAFGPFKDYIAEGKMPAEAKLRELQRQWDDVVTVVETLASCGISEVVDIQVKQSAEAAEEEQGNRRRNAKKNGRDKADDAAAKKPEAFTYVVTFLTRQAGLVKSLNAFTTGERFIVIDGFVFSREKDVIGEALGGGEKKSEQQAAGGRRRRRGMAAAVEEKKEDESKNGIVTDPLLDAPVKVEMTLTVYDFRTMDETNKTEEEKK